jgi:murein L,D-transpeptidase YcbB/YkuD
MNVLINGGKDRAMPLTTEHKQKVYLSMERWRWPVEEYIEIYLLVNIPEFQLRLIENNKTNLQVKMCISEAGRHETPILSGMVNYMQVNPVWNVSTSIAGTEILASLKNNGSY